MTTEIEEKLLKKIACTCAVLTIMNVLYFQAKPRCLTNCLTFTCQNSGELSETGTSRESSFSPLISNLISSFCQLKQLRITTKIEYSNRALHDAAIEIFHGFQPVIECVSVSAILPKMYTVDNSIFRSTDSM